MGPWLPSPGGSHSILLCNPRGEAAAGEGPVFSSRSHVHSSGAQTKSQAAASRAQNTSNPTHLRHRAAALPRVQQSPLQRLRRGAGMRAAAFPLARPQGTLLPRGGTGSDLRGVLSRRRWLQPLQLVEDVIYAGSLLGVHRHHGGEQALQGSRVPGGKMARRGCPCGAQHRGLPGSRVTLPSPSPGRGGHGDGVLHRQSHAVALLEDGVVGALPKHHAVQHAA